ncbi:MAG: hypothetical protein HGA37_11890 [Lentimicrobium sp.]|nr:hypothetical protein [Lentimicrobium sp.]
MKKNLQFLLALSILLIGSTISANAQSSCYDDYYKLFTERGATAIPDGTHEVVISVRDGNKCDCLMGKVEVKDNQIVNTLGVLLEDGSVKKIGVKLNSRYKATENPAILFLDITNGMSSTFLSDDNKMINMFFVKQLNPKAKAFKLAPPASSF